MSIVLVQHRINDPDAFFAKSEEVIGNAPAGVGPRQFCPSEDHRTAVCLWEGPSVDAVRDYVDSVSHGIAENTYYVVDEQSAFGIPEQAAASV
jgi:hypothetical protein